MTRKKMTKRQAIGFLLTSDSLIVFDDRVKYLKQTVFNKEQPEWLDSVIDQNNPFKPRSKSGVTRLLKACYDSSSWNATVYFLRFNVFNGRVPDWWNDVLVDSNLADTLISRIEKNDENGKTSRN